MLMPRQAAEDPKEALKGMIERMIIERMHYSIAGFLPVGYGQKIKVKADTNSLTNRVVTLEIVGEMSWADSVARLSDIKRWSPPGTPVTDHVLAAIKAESPKIKSSVKNRILHWAKGLERNSDQIMTLYNGFMSRGSLPGPGDWSFPKSVVVDRIQLGKVNAVAPPQDLLMVTVPYKITLTLTMDAILEGPFTKMPDREMNGLLEKWQEYNPDAFWHDGELRLSAGAAYKYYRDLWRKESPREQANFLKFLKSI